MRKSRNRFNARASSRAQAGDPDNGFELLAPDLMCVYGGALSFEVTQSERQCFEQSESKPQLRLKFGLIFVVAYLPSNFTYLFRSTDNLARHGASTDNGESENPRVPRGDGDLCPTPAALMAFSLCLGMTRVNASRY